MVGRLDSPTQRQCAPGPAGHLGHATRSAGSAPRHISPQALHSIHVLLLATLLRREVMPVAPMSFALCWISSAETQPGGRIGAWQDKGAAGEAGHEGLPERPLWRRERMRQP